MQVTLGEKDPFPFLSRKYRLKETTEATKRRTTENDGSYKSVTKAKNRQHQEHMHVLQEVQAILTRINRTENEMSDNSVHCDVNISS